MNESGVYMGRGSTLNEWQQKAVETTQGKVLILAGAGSGKTTVLTKRIEHLLHNNVPPEAILGLTFTNKAAKEMSLRLAQLVGQSVAKKVFLSTFHSFALYILRRESHKAGLSSHFTIADKQDVLRHLQTIVRDVLDHDKGDIPSLQCLLEDISSAKNRCVSIEEIAKNRGSSWYVEFSKEIFQRLQACFRVYGILDFDHMLWLLNDLFHRDEELLKKYSDRFQYIMIDEYQDTNPIQANIAVRLSSKWGNLCVVGDDDQSIYSWRGADVANILSFQADTIIKLEQNFRSTPTILRAANSVIQVNTERYEKSLWSVKDTGSPIQVIVAPSEQLEAEAVVSRIVAMKEKYGLLWKDFCVLYRSNALSKAIETELLKARYVQAGRVLQSIPYQVYGGDELYDHKEIKDVLAYMKVAVNPSDVLAGTRSLNYPRRGIGEVSIEYIRAQSEALSIPFFECICHILETPNLKENLSAKTQEGMRSYVNIIQKFQKDIVATKSVGRSVRSLVESMCLKEAIFSEVKSQAMRDWKDERLRQFFETIDAFQATAEGENACSDPMELLHACVSAFQLQEEKRAVSQHLAAVSDDENHVSLMTFHSAKGLEFPVCFLIGVEDHLIPHEKSLFEKGLEEERRLMYVALTRAKERLFLSMAMKRKRMGQEESSRPSRFIMDIPQECLQPVDWRAWKNI